VGRKEQAETVGVSGEKLEELLQDFKKQGFCLEEGTKLSIHAEESRRFMREVIGASQWQESILEEGLRVEFTSEPGKYSERNNKSALSRMEVVREKVGEWASKGFVQRISEPAWCNNPLSVAAKVDHETGKLKFRPCIDVSRHVKVMHVRLDDLTQRACWPRVNIWLHLTWKVSFSM
jgi:hypothetical protein